jgi:hypothetical protein
MNGNVHFPWLPKILRNVITQKLNPENYSLCTEVTDLNMYNKWKIRSLKQTLKTVTGWYLECPHETL